MEEGKKIKIKWKCQEEQDGRSIEVLSASTLARDLPARARYKIFVDRLSTFSIINSDDMCVQL